MSHSAARSLSVSSATFVNGADKRIATCRNSQKMWNGGVVKTRVSEISVENSPKYTNKVKVYVEAGCVQTYSDPNDPYYFHDVETYPVSADTKGSVNTSKEDESEPTAEEVEKLKKVSQPNSTDSASPYYTNKPDSNGLQPNSNQKQPKTHSTQQLEPMTANAPSPKSKPGSTSSTVRTNLTNIIKTDQQTKCMVRPVGSGKPMNFGKSQMSKLAIAKIEKTIERKNSNVSKRRTSVPFLKTGSINKLSVKIKRPDAIRSAMIDADFSTSGTISSSRSKKKSLLEESLTGGKMRETEWQCPVQTATTTVYVTPREKLLKHESLQRIWVIRNKMKMLKRNYQHFGLLLGDAESDEVESESIVFQKHWFSLSKDYNNYAGHNRKRDTKLAQLKTELRHKLKQQQWRFRDEYRDKMTQFLVSTARSQPNLAAFLIRLDSAPNQLKKDSVRWRKWGEHRGACGYRGPSEPACSNPAVPCVGYCLRHVSHNPNQLLFTPCTSPVAPDDRPCGEPVLDKGAHQSLCFMHQRLEVNLKKPKIIGTENNMKIVLVGKRNRSSLGSSRSGRSRKRKRQSVKDTKELESTPRIIGGLETSRIPIIANCVASFQPNPLVISKCDVDEAQDVEVGEEVLPLDSVELATLATQATKLLEEHDFSNVLNHLHTDAFSDLFAQDKGENVPTLQETEELERALEAVNQDVKSLEKMSQTQEILDLLDEQTIAQTLAALPEVPNLYQNGFGSLEQTFCALQPDGMSSLPIPPHADVLQS